MERASDAYVVDFPTTGFLVADWIEQHCIVPGGFHRNQPFVMSDWQLWCTVNHYRIKSNTPWVPDDPILAPAFQYRRSQIVAPQKTGKGPWTGGITCAEAVGPVVFAGWARRGDAYDCADNGCMCGWGYEYEPGEPMGMAWPTPLIQLVATSASQVKNIYDPFKAMVNGGPLGQLIRAGENFARIGEDGEVHKVTSSALSRLGNPITFAVFDETGIYTDQNKLKYVARTMRRGLAGIGGRSIETTNAWDPSKDSTAQNTYESRAQDIFRFFNEPPAQYGWDFKKKRDRRKILEYVYQGSPWVNLDGIEAEAAELMEKDPEEAERFFGNTRVQGQGSWMPKGLWSRTESAVSA